MKLHILLVFVVVCVCDDAAGECVVCPDTEHVCPDTLPKRQDCCGEPNKCKCNPGDTCCQDLRVQESRSQEHVHARLDSIAMANLTPANALWVTPAAWMGATADVSLRVKKENSIMLHVTEHLSNKISPIEHYNDNKVHR